MPHIKFTQDRTTSEEVPQVFKAGQVYELSIDSCERWIRRGAAEYVVPAAKADSAPAARVKAAPRHK